MWCHKFWRFKKNYENFRFSTSFFMPFCFLSVSACRWMTIDLNHLCSLSKWKVHHMCRIEEHNDIADPSIDRVLAFGSWPHVQVSLNFPSLFVLCFIYYRWGLGDKNVKEIKVIASVHDSIIYMQLITWFTLFHFGSANIPISITSHHAVFLWYNLLNILIKILRKLYAFNYLILLDLHFL